MLIPCRHKKEILNLKNLLSAGFEMKDLGPTKRILGMDLFMDKEKGKLTISQQGYLQKVVDIFGMKEAIMVTTPLRAHFKVSSVCDQNEKLEAAYMRDVPYSNAIGSVMYVMISSRPDITFGRGRFGK